VTWRLVLGVVFTERRSLFGAMVIIGLISRPTSWEWLTGGLVMLIAAGAGAHTSLDKRELVVLPSSPRELYRAAWILSAALPLAVLMLARVVGGAWHGFASDEGWAFHATPVRVLFEIVYFSLVGATAAGRPDRYEPDFREDPNLVPFLLGVLVMAAVPFVVIPWLPDRISDVPVMAWLVGAAGLGIGLTPLLRTPEWHRRESRPASSPESSRPSVRPHGAVAPLRTSGIGGIWVPTRSVAIQAFVWTVVMVAFVAFVLYTQPERTIGLAFDDSLDNLRFLMTLGFPFLLLIGLCPGLAPWVGALKRLPLSSRETALFMSLVPAMVPVMYWTALLVISVVVAKAAPNTFRLTLLAAIIGAASLVDALGTKAGSSTAKLGFGFLGLVVLLFGVDENRALVAAVMEHWALALAGLLALALSWFVNLHTLTRSPGSARVFRFNRSAQSMGAR
jgi:hypothetical protein